MVISKVKENKYRIARISRYNTEHEQVYVARKAIKWSMITRIIEGQGWYFSPWIRPISWKTSKCWWWSQQILSRGSTKKQSNNDYIKQHDWCSEKLLEPHIRHKLEIKIVVQWEMIWWGSGRKISSSSKIVLREEGPGSTDKISMIMMQPSRLGMTDRVQTRKQRILLRVV